MQQLCKRVCAKVCMCTQMYVRQTFPPWMPLTWGQSLLQDSRQRACPCTGEQARLSHPHPLQLHEQGKVSPLKVFPYSSIHFLEETPFCMEGTHLLQIIKGCFSKNPFFYNIANFHSDLLRYYWRISEQAFTNSLRLYLFTLWSQTVTAPSHQQYCPCLDLAQLCALASVHVGLFCSFQTSQGNFDGEIGVLQLNGDIQRYEEGKFWRKRRHQNLQHVRLAQSKQEPLCWCNISQFPSGQNVQYTGGKRLHTSCNHWATGSPDWHKGL